MNDARKTIHQTRDADRIDDRASVAHWLAFGGFVMVANLKAIGCNAKAAEDDQEAPSRETWLSVT